MNCPTPFAPETSFLNNTFAKIPPYRVGFWVKSRFRGRQAKYLAPRLGGLKLAQAVEF